MGGKEKKQTKKTSSLMLLYKPMRSIQDLSSHLRVRIISCKTLKNKKETQERRKKYIPNGSVTSCFTSTACDYHLQMTGLYQDSKSLRSVVFCNLPKLLETLKTFEVKTLFAFASKTALNS